ncbi:MAG: alpha/beta fold hydrolase [Polyangiales bacterium]|jgi:dienelactone hydrolase
MQKLSSMIGMAVVLCAASQSASSADDGFKGVDFPSAGGIDAHADLYQPKNRSATLILLFHQAGWSRGEYREIAPKLVEAGYRVLAVDQRSGGAIRGVSNETAKRAVEKAQPRGYADAYADLEAALTYARSVLKAKRVVAWGSSYSASLVFRLAAEHAGEVNAVVAFSPGEYFEKDGGRGYIQSFAKRVKQPVFVTSSKKEREQVKPIFDASPAAQKVLFTPDSNGQHGSRALWAEWPDHDAYWIAVREFLKSVAPPS